MAGEKIVSNGITIGMVSSVFFEDGKKWFIINDDYEQSASEFEFIMDLTNGESYLRPKGGKNVY